MQQAVFYGSSSQSSHFQENGRSNYSSQSSPWQIIRLVDERQDSRREVAGFSFPPPPQPPGSPPWDPSCKTRTGGRTATAGGFNSGQPTAQQHSICAGRRILLSPGRQLAFAHRRPRCIPFECINNGTGQVGNDRPNRQRRLPIGNTSIATAFVLPLRLLRRLRRRSFRLLTTGRFIRQFGLGC